MSVYVLLKPTIVTKQGANLKIRHEAIVKIYRYFSSIWFLNIQFHL
jgi:hypothetical protein